MDVCPQSKSESEEAPVHLRKYTVDHPLLNHTLLSLSSGREYNFDEPSFFQQSEPSKSFTAISETDEQSFNDAQFIDEEDERSPLMHENEIQFKSLMQYSQGLERKLEEQRVKHEEEVHIHIFSVLCFICV